MNLLIGMVAALVGAVLFEMRSQALVGALCGLLIAMLWRQLASLKQQLAALEHRLNQRQAPGATRSPATTSAASPATDPFRGSGFSLVGDPGADDPELEPLLEPSAVRRPALAGAAGSTPRQPAAPRTAPVTAGEPNRQLELWNIVVAYFTGGNLVVRIGVVVLFFGVAFLLKYSAERNLVPIELRLVGVALGALVLLGVGWRLRLRRTDYALILQGGAVGVLYLTIFAALRLYQLLPAGVVLPLLIAMSGCSAALAILQDARVLAVIGVLGGFLAPLLTSTGSGSHVMLFSYFALLNVVILLIARQRSWRELNLLGFVFTFGLGALWGHANYAAELFAVTEPFLVLFFLFYLTIGVLFASQLPLPRKGYLDGTLIFGTPIVCFALQARLVEPYTYGLAGSALVMGLIYSLLAWLLFKKGNPAMRTLVEAFLAIGVVFATVAIPLALDGRWTATAWALEGAAMVWIALKQQRWMPRLFGLALQPLAAGAFLLDVPWPVGQLVIFNGFYLGCLLISLAGFFSGLCLERARSRLAGGRLESSLMLAWGLLWWFAGGAFEIERFAVRHQELALLLGFVAISSGLAMVVGRRLGWNALGQVYFGLLPAMLAAAAWSALDFGSRPSIHGGAIAWPLAFMLHYGLLRWDEQGPLAGHQDKLHVGLLWLLIGLCSWEATWWIDHLVRGPGVWDLVVLGAVPALFMLALCRCWGALIWPLAGRQRTYLYHALLPVAGYLWLGSLASNLLSRGNPWPLPYLPLLNPFDLTQACVYLALAWWFYVLGVNLEIQVAGLQRRTLVLLGGGSLFLWLNGMLIRTLHYWGGVPFSLRAMTGSDLVQMTLSIVWTLTAMLIMFRGRRSGLRQVWMAGAALIGTVIVKLFLFDLAHTSTVERIVSFIGVGLLCLAIGYLAPLPPRTAAKEAAR